MRRLRPRATNAVVAELPHRSVGIPHPTGLLHSPSGGDISERDPQRDDLIRSEPRLPSGLGYDELHGLDPPLPGGVVPVTHTDQAVSVLLDEMLRALLTRLEMEPDRCGDGGGHVLARRGAAGRATGGNARRLVGAPSLMARPHERAVAAW
jgi:hypothetical protein